MKRFPLAHRIALSVLVLAATAARAGVDCDAPPESWQPRSALSELAQRNGWQIDRVKIDDGCYEVIGRDANGRQFKAKVDPVTLQVIRLKHGRHERERLREREGRGSPASTPGDPP
jgi:hypothetical protein